MRVLHVLHHYFPILDGYTVRSMYILRCQSAMGIEVSALTSIQQGPASEDHLEGVHVFRTQGSARERPLLREAHAMWHLRRRLGTLIPQVRPDVIHAHSPSIVALPSLLAAQAAGIPFVYEVRDLWENASVDRGKFSQGSPLYRLARALDTFVLRRSDAVVTICQSLADHLSSRMRGRRTPWVVGNGVDLDDFQPAEARPEWQERWGLVGSEVVAHVGGFQPYEGLDLMLRALPRVASKRPAVKLLLVGAGEEEAHLRELSAAPNLANRVVFAGRVPHESVREAYSVADLMVYPRISTRTTNLTTPLKPLEAMAMQRAVLVSDLPPMKEIVERDVTGFMCQANSVEALADSCADALSDAARLRRVAASGRDYVARERVWMKLAGRYEPLYRRLTDTGSQLGIGRGECARL